MAVITAFAVILMIIKFGHPDDKNVAKFPKVVTFLGLWLAFASVLIIPYDVANSRGQGLGVDVGLLWQIMYICFAIIAFILIPFAFFFYESDVDPKAKQGKSVCSRCCGSQIGSAACYTFFFFIIFATLLLIMYLGLNTAEIPVKRIIYSPNYKTTETQLQGRLVEFSQLDPCQDKGTYRTVDNKCQALPKKCSESDCLIDTYIWEIPITFPVSVMAGLSLLGWVFFTMFVGVGMVALPLDLINEFRTKPKAISTTHWIEQKDELAKKAVDLISVGESLNKIILKNPDMGRKEVKRHKKILKKFELNYYFLKKEYQLLDISHRLKGGNTLWYTFKLVLGVLGALVSFTWLLHICLFVLPSKPIHPFLNSYFNALEIPGFDLFGVCAFGTWAYYLLWCVIKGNFKLGVRFLIWKIYPMEINNTMMNSFLFNTFIILICSVPTVQFCVTAFPSYARYTDVDMLFGTQIKYLKGVNVLWENNIFTIILVSISGLTALLLFFKPNDKAKEIDDEIKKLVAEAD